LFHSEKIIAKYQQFYPVHNKFYMLKELVQFHRKQAGLSRKKLAEIAGVSETVIYYLEKGKETLQWNIVSAILHALNITITFHSPLMQEYEKSKSVDQL
jgi:HTH-type transcriptional regulator / antitoxin HipB